MACGDDGAPSLDGGEDASDSGSELAEFEEGEDRPGGETTTDTIDASAFVQEAANLSILNRGRVEAGIQFFRLIWVPAPSRPEADGLGPIFNAVSCVACHEANGRGQHPLTNAASPSVLLRLGSADGAPDPLYGDQLQTAAIPGVSREAQVIFGVESAPWISASGHVFSRSALVVSPVFGGAPLDGATRVSPRVTPHLVGQGLLEAIPLAALESVADENDTDGDGISGRLARLSDGRVGRFGWKASQAGLVDQVAAAFLGDVGITSPLHPTENCARSDQACLSAPTGGSPEINARRLAFVAEYLALLGVPARRAPRSAEVLRGKQLFREVGCAACHTPSYETGTVEAGDTAFVELERQRIWPYTDLLLHDMGEELSDGMPEGDAEVREWRTPPLWGVGLLGVVHGEQRLLHDGRAANVTEAILWHGGEGGSARNTFAQLREVDRVALVAFVNSL